MHTFSYNAPTENGRGIPLYRIGVNHMKFNTKLEKSRYNSAIDRINSNIDYALKKGLEFTDYHQDFQNKMVRYGVVLTPTGKISKKSNLTPAQLKELERTSKVAGRFQKKYGSTENAKKVINVQKFLNTSVEYIYEKIKNAETEEEFDLAQKFDKMLEDGLTRYDYDEIYSVLNKLGAFDTDYEYNPFLDKYPSREERKKIAFKRKKR